MEESYRHPQSEDRVPYKTGLQPFGAYFVIIFISIVCITNGYAVFFDFNGSDFVAAYITLPIVFFLYVAHRIYSYFYLGDKEWFTAYENFDFSKLELVEEEARSIPPRIPKNIWEKIYYAIL